jgi:hypothetical protein
MSVKPVNPVSKKKKEKKKRNSLVQRLTPVNHNYLEG